MDRAETVVIVQSGHVWRVFQGEQPMELPFVELGAALDAAMELGNGRLVRVVIRDAEPAADESAA